MEKRNTRVDRGWVLGLGVFRELGSGYPFTWRHSLWMTFPALSFKNCIEIESVAATAAAAPTIEC